MVAKTNIKKKFALVSTFDKKNLLLICKIFKKYNIEIISTGSTSKTIKKFGFKYHNVSDLTKFKEILDGRVKTLHPKIHASILFIRKNNKHIKTFNLLNFPKIDFIVVNLYPFEKSINKKSSKEIIEMIDIGGPALIRSGAKNYESVTTICSPDDYILFEEEMNKFKGKTSLSFRKNMASKVFNKTSNYDALISKFLQPSTKIPQLSNYEKRQLRYGENSNQKAFIFLENKQNIIFKNKIYGKDISYNNVLDIDAGMNCLNDFTEPTCVIIKHNNPCGVASHKKIEIAYKNSILSDPISSFGGVVLINKVANLSIAKEISKKFTSVFVAKGFTNQALSTLRNNKNIILINSKNINVSSKNELKSINDGFVIQEKNLIKIKITNLLLKSNFKSNTSNKNDLVFALKVCKHVKSNAVVFCKNKKTVGIGAGQMSRLDSCKIALKKLTNDNNKKGFVVASDGFFPFTDNLETLTKKNCEAIAQPGGSINDKKIIQFANKKKLALFFIKNRLFKH